jgi:type III pantothenate kinase
MLMVVDAGNTNVKFAVFDSLTLRAQWRLRMDPERTADEYTALLYPLIVGAGLTYQNVTNVTIACVVPLSLPSLLRFSRMTLNCEPVQVNGNVDLGMTVAYRPPEAVGADRLADAVAAVAKYGAPCLVIDFGTATTFNAIAAAVAPETKPTYLGGAICLGIGVSLEALYARAAKIPPVGLARPPQAIGDNTTHALQSGIVHGYAALVEGMVSRFRAEMLAPDCPVIATGGHAALIASETDCITAVEPLLTLEGLRIIAEQNRAQEKKP